MKRFLAAAVLAALPGFAAAGGFPVFDGSWATDRNMWRMEDRDWTLQDLLYQGDQLNRQIEDVQFQMEQLKEMGIPDSIDDLMRYNRLAQSLKNLRDRYNRFAGVYNSVSEQNEKVKTLEYNIENNVCGEGKPCTDEERRQLNADKLKTVYTIQVTLNQYAADQDARLKSNKEGSFKQIHDELDNYLPSKGGKETTGDIQRKLLHTNNILANQIVELRADLAEQQARDYNLRLLERRNEDQNLRDSIGQFVDTGKVVEDAIDVSRRVKNSAEDFIN